MGRRRLATLVVAAAAAAVAAASAGATSSLKPLWSLGPLRPAPYPGDPGPEVVPIPRAPALAPPGSTARATRTVDGIGVSSTRKSSSISTST